jgi:hypothetical protein
LEARHPRKHNTLDMKERVRILDFMREGAGICREIAPGTAQYDSGWSDVRVAQSLGVTVHNVSSVRLQWFGKLRQRVEASVEERLTKLEEQVARLSIVLN